MYDTSTNTFDYFSILLRLTETLKAGKIPLNIFPVKIPAPFYKKIHYL